MTAPAVLLVPIDAQIALVQRHLDYRMRANAERIAAGRLTQQRSDKELDTWRAVIATLERAKAKT